MHFTEEKLERAGNEPLDAEHGYSPVPKGEVFKEIFEQAGNLKKYSI